MGSAQVPFGGAQAPEFELFIDNARFGIILSL